MPVEIGERQFLKRSPGRYLHIDYKTVEVRGVPLQERSNTSLHQRDHKEHEDYWPEFLVRLLRLMSN